ncbi:MAG TPA: EscU/YscU/HrcU family type III secretion system export apparatus switch protein [Egibacteraceae bacterium]|nr:EscU/YscU/HrcU family type III secretion system export apparatus switch protein [Egibacteraceae bacterium]
MGRFDGKTEKATPQRRQKARREGTVARSQEVGVAVSLVAAAVVLRVFGGRGFEVLREETRLLLAVPSTGAVDLAAVAGSGTRMALALGGPPLVAGVVAALAAGFGQVGFRLTPRAAKPKLSHLSPKKGLQRLKPSRAGWELIRTTLKLGLLLAIVWAPLQGWATELAADRGLDGGLAATLDQTWGVVIRAVLLATVIAAADYGWNRHRTAKELRMSKDEVRREYKDAEGDPLMRAQRKRRHSELSRNRMLRDVATADVVVTNPTHLAVALRYADGEAAPRVVARGADRLAAKIRAEAYRHGVTVTEDRPLARALFRRCKAGQYVPAALYEAVAVVLALAYRRRGIVPARAAS